MDDIRVLVCGSRHWDLGDFAEHVVSGLLVRHGPGLLIVHGHCPTGVDASIDEAAAEVGVRVERHPADWSLGKKAGPLRNQAMVDAGAVKCLAFAKCLSSSRGTRDCASRAIAAVIPTWWVRAEDVAPELQVRSRWATPRAVEEAAR